MFLTKVLNSFKFSKALLTPMVQKKAPEFAGTALVNGKFKNIKLLDFQNQYVVLYFYPFNFTFVCPTEIVAFSDRMKEFQKLNTQVVGVSCDSHFSHYAWSQLDRKSGGIGQLEYPLLSDFNKEIARDYDVLIEEGGMALRGLFIIDGKSVVRHMSINDLPVGRNVDEVLRLVKAFQFSDEHGEVCPAEWNEKNKSTIIPDPVKSKEYFSKQ
ncbi:hypothetical protein SNEBB_010801 [Seison nebaliae]|nr:hypothetical protein SNEBB_010801 [Seison nebaliae]